MYVADRDKRLKYVSGFTGHGLAVVTSSKAALWSPGLYTLQANEELSCDWILIGQTSVDVSNILYYYFISSKIIDP
jgi:Xaa-Pro aminopeptidase